jgi:hypothetical protein
MAGVLDTCFHDGRSSPRLDRRPVGCG